MFLVLLAALVGWIPSPAEADLGVIINEIVRYNQRALTQDLERGVYEGREGLLALLPETARQYGLSALENETYQLAREHSRGAAASRDACLEALKDRSPETRPGEHAERAGEHALAYLENRARARSLFREYHEQVLGSVDQRLDPGACKALLGDILEKSLARANRNLRDALALFYNETHGLAPVDDPLRPENVGFVNLVFKTFLRKGDANARAAYDLDHHHGAWASSRGTSWKRAVAGRGAAFAGLVERLLKTRVAKNPLSLDPLLFLALMKQESRFEPRAVSNVGAAGLTQIMPRTALGLGMKRVFLPEYFRRAGDLLARQAQLKQKALKFIEGITPQNARSRAAKARALMQEAISLREKGVRLYERYRRELLSRGRDDRLDPEKAIYFGLKYFREQLKRQKGDISLALAAYNAGPRRVTRYGGIPPFEETVTFRNAVLGHYNRYLRRLNGGW